MSETAKQAVFLSYASQNAEAAMKICDALRAVGVEVWFDQNELVGGDAWDAKIRKQVAECALFVPLISAATQARREGYFRLEWRIAAQRTHMMSESIAFLLPVVIDATRDAEADVPAEFKAVQWTRLPGGDTPEKFCTRVKKLLGGKNVAPASGPAGSAGEASLDDVRGRGPVAPLRKPLRPWLVPALLGAAAIAAVALWRPWKNSAATPAPVTPAAAPLSEARRLEQQARALIDDDPLRVRENYRTACELCERATTLSPDDADAWATYARASCVLFSDYNERGDKAIAAARLRAERAIRLAPDSLEANLAKAQYAIQVSGDEATGERQLRALLERAPNDRRILRALTWAAAELVDRQPDKLAESRQWAERAEALPGGDTLALTKLCWGYWGLNRFRELDALLDRILTRQPTSDAYHLKVMVLAAWGDMDGVLSWLEKIPPAVLSEDRVASVAIQAYLSKRQPDKALALLARLPREFLEEGRYFSPKSYLAGLALAMAGKPRAAEIEFRTALKAVEDRIAAKPNDARLFAWKGRILAHLGDRAGAAREFETGRELSSNPSSTIAPADLMLLGRFDEAIAVSDGILQRNRSRWPSFFSQLKFSQDYDPLRNDPRFAALIARGDGWVREMRSPAATRLGAATGAQAMDDKSVAVLAFANLSDDKANEYFSDGISEELLNVLAKIPGLKVTARTSSFYFKGKEVQVPEIARELGVAYVVEGSVRKSGDQVRITAQLIKAADGFHVWSDTFTRELKDIFAVQDEIAGLIAKNLQVTLGAGNTSGDKSTNVEAWQLYLDGRRAWNLRTREGYREAETLFQRAIALDGRFARAYAALADVWQLRAIDENAGVFSPQWRTLPTAIRSRTLIDKALEIDPRCAEANASLGMNLQLGWQDEPALQAYRRAIELNPNYATAHQWLGLALLGVGMMDDTLSELKQATELDPLSHRILSDYAKALNFSGHPEEALAVSRRALAIQPGDVQAVLQEARAFALLGRPREVVALVEGTEKTGLSERMRPEAIAILAMAKQPEGIRRLIGDVDALPASTLKLASLVALGRTDGAFANLESGLAWDGWGLSEAAYGQLFDPIRRDARFQKMIETSGRAEYFHRAQAWRRAHPPEKPEAKK